MGRYVFPGFILTHNAQLTMSIIVLLAFVVCGGLLFELLRVVPEIWGMLTRVLG